MTGPRLTGGRCQCTACDELFSSVREFDRHRTGAYADPGQYLGKRRCLTPAELTARGWRTNERGFWMQGRPGRAPADAAGPRIQLPDGDLRGRAHAP